MENKTGYWLFVRNDTVVRKGDGIIIPTTGKLHKAVMDWYVDFTIPFAIYRFIPYYRS